MNYTAVASQVLRDLWVARVGNPVPVGGMYWMLHDPVWCHIHSELSKRKLLVWDNIEAQTLRVEEAPQWTYK